MPDEDLVSYVLAALRAAHGFTQKELADRTGFDEARITRWETGCEEPSVDVLNILLNHLKTTPAEFFKLQSLLLRIIERPDSFSEGIEESLERHSRRGAEGSPTGGPRQVAETGAAGWARSTRPTADSVVEGLAQAMRDRVERGTGAPGPPPIPPIPPLGGDGPEVGPLAQEVDLLAKETARLVESHVRLFYRALAGPTAAPEPDEQD